MKVANNIRLSMTKWWNEMYVRHYMMMMMMTFSEHWMHRSNNLLVWLPCARCCIALCGDYEWRTSDS